MSDTPLTENESYHAYDEMLNPLGLVVDAEFSKRLERSLASKDEVIANKELELDAERNNSLALVKQLSEKTREIQLLRQYGNKDCTAMVDEVMKASKSD